MLGFPIDFLDQKEDPRAAIYYPALELAVLISDSLFGGLLPIFVLGKLVRGMTELYRAAGLQTFKPELCRPLHAVSFPFKINAQLV